jgi:DNA mismatch endonuclease, patch repair protein
MDNHARAVRSRNMSHIHSSNTKPEDIVRKYLFLQGFRYRKNVKRLPGSPDVVLAKYRTALFINGCFWHMHQGCKDFVWPSSNVEYWRKKLCGNAKRDIENTEKLELLGWRVMVVWECQLKADSRENTLGKLCSEIRSEGKVGE